MQVIESRCLMLVLVLVAAQAQAQQYRWVDDKGHVQYTDTPPPASAKGVQKKNFNAAKTADEGVPYVLRKSIKEAPVKLYTAPGSKDSDSARAYLNKRGIPFKEISVVYDSQAAELKAVSGRAAVPVMLVGRAMQRGFDESAYGDELDAAGYPKVGTLPARHQEAPPVPPRPGVKDAARSSGAAPAGAAK